MKNIFLAVSMLLLTSFLFAQSNNPGFSNTSGGDPNNPNTGQGGLLSNSFCAGDDSGNLLGCVPRTGVDPGTINYNPYDPGNNPGNTSSDPLGSFGFLGSGAGQIAYAKGSSFSSGGWTFGYGNSGSIGNANTAIAKQIVDDRLSYAFIAAGGTSKTTLSEAIAALEKARRMPAIACLGAGVGGCNLKMWARDITWSIGFGQHILQALYEMATGNLMEGAYTWDVPSNLSKQAGKVLIHMAEGDSLPEAVAKEKKIANYFMERSKLPNQSRWDPNQYNLRYGHVPEEFVQGKD